MYYGLFQWVFMVLAFVFGISALLRLEVFSTHSTQRTHRHSGQQALLWMASVACALVGFVMAVLAVREGMR
ncbi:hypothetical protein AOC05_17035 [Arthrobacter alpinus]|uniref:Uncharacterized protein n=2 Tax=Arthrobacter alpinus TaxID=656366 RepID=A0A0M4R0T7_9MICC|nr:hypothetical protein AOC05_17035 [Arthrobacter alpinus]